TTHHLPSIFRERVMTVTDTTSAASDTEQAVVLDPIEDAIADFAAGRAVVVVDDEDRENEGDIIFSAELATPELLAFMIRHTSGVVCVPMEGKDLDRLELPLMTARNEESLGTAYTITVDAREEVTTGISAADRAHTIALLARDDSRPTDSVDRGWLPGLRPAGGRAKVGNDAGPVARLSRLRELADAHGLNLGSVEQLVTHRSALGETLSKEQANPPLVTRTVETRLPNRHGQWRAVGFRGAMDGAEHVALVLGDLGEGTDVLARLHSECLTGDAFGSHRCDCGAQLDAAMADIAREGRGVVVYLGGHEGRGIGLLHKL